MASVAVETALPWQQNDMTKLQSKRSSMASVQMIIEADRRNSSACSGPMAGFHSRVTSIASMSTLSRNTFSSQVACLTTVRLPQPAMLERSTVTTASAIIAFKALEDAAHDLLKWVHNASQVLQGLDAEDDIGWAAAAGREGLAQIDDAMKNFEDLIQAYITSVEGLQSRQDSALVAKTEMIRLLDLIEEVTSNWEKQKKRLQSVKLQVELSLEWEELQSGVLNEIATELAQLTEVVYEMEERRHNNDYGFYSTTDASEVEYTAQSQDTTSSSPVSPSPFGHGPTPRTSANTSLISLVARMQPLRASLDFLPMRLSTFLQRAQTTFPTACKDLEARKVSLESRWNQLEMDARALKKELGEDRWIVVFRNAAQQAVRMMDSVQRSIAQVEEALKVRTSVSQAAMIQRKIESYHAKTKNYCPAVERVLDILVKGAKERASINGEVIRLQTDAKQRWELLGTAIRKLDTRIARYEAERRNNIRESLSEIDTEHHLHDPSIDKLTPASSPASSVYLLSPIRTRQELHPSSPTARPRLRSRMSSLNVRSSFSRTFSKEPLTPAHTPKTSLLPVRPKEESSLLSASLNRRLDRPITPSYNNASSITPFRSSQLLTPASTAIRPTRPRWNSSTKVDYAKKDATTTPVAMNRSPLLQRDSAVGLAASYTSDSISSTTPLRSKRSRYLNTADQSLAAPQNLPSNKSRPDSRARSPFAASQNNRLSLAAPENLPSYSPRPNSRAQTPLSNSFTRSTSHLNVPTPLRARASMGVGHLSSAYRTETPLTPRSGTSFGQRRDQHGLPTPQSLHARPRWRS